MQSPNQPVASARVYLQHLEDACNWLSLDKGRAIEYNKRLKQFNQREDRDEVDLLSYFESFELVEIYLLWGAEIDRFPGLKRHVRSIFQKGPVLRSDENPNKSTNRARNNAFPVILAGRFLASNFFIPQVEGYYRQASTISSNADFSLIYRGSEFNVECKRPFSLGKLVERATEARNQIANSRRNGIVAIDCSRLVHDPSSVFDNSGQVKVEEFGANYLETNIVPRVKFVFCTRVCGLLLFCRIPAFTPIGGEFKDSQQSRRDCATALICVGNPSYSVDVEMMHEITERLEESTQSIMSRLSR